MPQYRIGFKVDLPKVVDPSIASYGELDDGDISQLIHRTIHFDMAIPKILHEHLDNYRKNMPTDDVRKRHKY